MVSLEKKKLSCNGDNTILLFSINLITYEKVALYYTQYARKSLPVGPKKKEVIVWYNFLGLHNNC